MADKDDHAKFANYLAPRAPGKRQVKPNVNFLESQTAEFDSDDDDDVFISEKDLRRNESDDEDGSDESGSDQTDDSDDDSNSSRSGSGSDTEDEDSEQDESKEDVETESISGNGMPTLSLFDVQSDSPATNSEAAPVLSREYTTQVVHVPLSQRKTLAPRTICTLCLNMKHRTEEIVQCDKCGISVHESCYGPADYHDDQASQSSSCSTEPWFCEPCLYGLIEPPHCALCPDRFGAFKRAEGGNWVHLNCALWSPGVTFVDEYHLTAVSWRNVDSKEFGKKSCSLCPEKIEARTGMTMQCDAALCKNFFHISCAQKHGFLFDHSESSAASSSAHDHTLDPRIVACKKHSDADQVKQQRRAYVRMQDEEERRMVNYRRKILTPREMRKRDHQKRIHLENWKSLNITYNTAEPGPRLLHQHPEFVKEMQEKMDEAEGGADEFRKSFSRVKRVEKINFLPAGFSTEFAQYFEHRQTMVIPRVQAELAENAKNIGELKKRQEIIHEKINQLQIERNQTRVRAEASEKKLKLFHDVITSLGAKKVKTVKTTMSTPSSAKRGKGRQSRGSTSLQSRPQLLIKKCFECEHTNDQHLLALCDMCHNHYHLACLDPPLTTMPKKTRTEGWMCSTCAESSDEEEPMKVDEPSTSRTRRRVPQIHFTPDNTSHKRAKHSK